MTQSRGAAATEYALLAALIAVVLIIAVYALGGHASHLFDLNWPTH